MRLSSHIRKHPRTGLYWYRRVVPPALRGSVPPVEGFEHKPERVEFSKTLNTRDKAEANRAAALLDRAVEAALQEALTGEPGNVITRARLWPFGQRMLSERSEQWKRHELARRSDSFFNGATTPEWWEEAANPPDVHYRLQQFAASSRSLPDGWRDIPNFDKALRRALASQRLQVPDGHPSVPILRPSFAEAWHELLRAAEKMRHGVWNWREAEEAQAGPSIVGAKERGSGTPFLYRLEEWQKLLPTKDRQRDMYVADVRAFASSGHGLTIEHLTKVHVQSWVGELLRRVRAKRCGGNFPP